MNLTIDLSEQNAAELEAEARAAHLPADRYFAKIVAQALESRHTSKVQKLEEHLDYMASQVVPGTTADEMEAAPIQQFPRRELPAIFS
jgi:hypothetical protein